MSQQYHAMTIQDRVAFIKRDAADRLADALRVAEGAELRNKMDACQRAYDLARSQHSAYEDARQAAESMTLSDSLTRAHQVHAVVSTTIQSMTAALEAIDDVSSVYVDDAYSLIEAEERVVRAYADELHVLRTDVMVGTMFPDRSSWTVDAESRMLAALLVQLDEVRSAKAQALAQRPHVVSWRSDLQARLGVVQSTLASIRQAYDMRYTQKLQATQDQVASAESTTHSVASHAASATEAWKHGKTLKARAAAQRAAGDSAWLATAQEAAASIAQAKSMVQAASAAAESARAELEQIEHAIDELMGMRDELQMYENRSPNDPAFQNQTLEAWRLSRLPGMRAAIENHERDLSRLSGAIADEEAVLEELQHLEASTSHDWLTAIANKLSETYEDAEHIYNDAVALIPEISGAAARIDDAAQRIVPEIVAAAADMADLEQLAQSYRVATPSTEDPKALSQRLEDLMGVISEMDATEARGEAFARELRELLDGVRQTLVTIDADMDGSSISDSIDALDARSNEIGQIKDALVAAAPQYDVGGPIRTRIEAAISAATRYQEEIQAWRSDGLVRVLQPYQALVAGYQGQQNEYDTTVQQALQSLAQRAQVRQELGELVSDWRMRVDQAIAAAQEPEKRFDATASEAAIRLVEAMAVIPEDIVPSGVRPRWVDARKSFAQLVAAHERSAFVFSQLAAYRMPRARKRWQPVAPVISRMTSPKPDAVVGLNRPYIQIMYNNDPNVREDPKAGIFEGRLFDMFVVTQMIVSDAEKFDVVETFGAPHFFTSGKFAQRVSLAGYVRSEPRVPVAAKAEGRRISTRGALIPDMDEIDEFDRVSDYVVMKMLYDQHWRATLLADRKGFLRLYVDGDFFDGYIQNMQFSRSSDIDSLVQWTMQFVAFRHWHVDQARIRNALAARYSAPELAQSGDMPEKYALAEIADAINDAALYVGKTADRAVFDAVSLRLLYDVRQASLKPLDGSFGFVRATRAGESVAVAVDSEVADAITVLLDGQVVTPKLTLDRKAYAVSLRFDASKLSQNMRELGKLDVRVVFSRLTRPSDVTIVYSIEIEPSVETLDLSAVFTYTVGSETGVLGATRSKSFFMSVFGKEVPLGLRQFCVKFSAPKPFDPALIAYAPTSRVALGVAKLGSEPNSVEWTMPPLFIAHKVQSVAPEDGGRRLACDVIMDDSVAEALARMEHPCDSLVIELDFMVSGERVQYRISGPVDGFKSLRSSKVFVRVVPSGQSDFAQSKTVSGITVRLACIAADPRLPAELISKAKALLKKTTFSFRAEVGSGYRAVGSFCGDPMTGQLRLMRMVRAEGLPTAVSCALRSVSVSDPDSSGTVVVSAAYALAQQHMRDAHFQGVLRSAKWRSSDFLFVEVPNYEVSPFAVSNAVVYGSK